MNDYNLSLDFDYVNQKIKGSIVFTGKIDDPSEYKLEVYDTNGILVCTPNTFEESYKIVDHSRNPHSTSGNYVSTMLANTECDFGFTAKSNASPHTNSGLLLDSDIIHGIGVLSGIFLQTGLDSPTQAGALIGTPIIGIDGEFVFRGRVDSVTGKNTIVFSSPTGALTQTTGNAALNDFRHDLLYIYSGNGSGQYSTVLSTGSLPNSFIMDRDFTSYSGCTFKVFPRRTITGYSPWSDGYVVAKYYLDRPIATGLARYTTDITVDTLTYPPGYIPAANSDSFPKPMNDYIGSLAPQNGMLIWVAKETGFNINPTTGDVIQYRSSSTPTILNQIGVIYKVISYDADKWTVWVYPSGNPSVTSSYTNGIVAAANEFKIMNYPKFNTDHIAVLRHNDYVVATQVIKTPSAELDYAANDYESVFGTVSSTAHFHVGPLRVSNGQVLTGNAELKFTASLYNGNPTQTTPVKTWTGFTTANANTSEYLSGEYSRHGTFVGNYSQIYTSAEMLMLVYGASLGNIQITNIVNIPVQPSV